jgi:serine O-acetyltransferase
MQRYGVYISEKAEIADSVKFPHPIGVVIGEGVVIGKNVKIFQNVTIGGARIGDVRAGRYPTVSDGVVIFAGAVIVGEITIGENSIIGANAVVVRNVPPFSTCVGVPGRVTPRKC